MTIEMDDGIIAKGRVCRWSATGQRSAGRSISTLTGRLSWAIRSSNGADGAKADIGFVRSGSNQQDIDAITGGRGRQIHRIVLAAELALHATMLCSVPPVLRIAQGLHGRASTRGSSLAIFRGQVFQASAVGIVYRNRASPAVEQGFKGPFAPMP